jgi:SulP family sulfate permease
MERIDIIPDLIPEEHIFNEFEECVKWVKENVEDKH